MSQQSWDQSQTFMDYLWHKETLSTLLNARWTWLLSSPRQSEFFDDSEASKLLYSQFFSSSLTSLPGIGALCSPVSGFIADLPRQHSQLPLEEEQRMG